MKVIGIGASAGGLEAITRLLAEIPDGTGAVYVFLQHLSPGTKSMIGDLLKNHTGMPVTMVYEDQPVRANQIYVMAENKNLVFANGMLITQDRAPEPEINLPIDLFFNSLGEALGSDAVGVLLSGTGTDGTRGLRKIKEKGGFVLVQSPESAKFNGMPKAAIDLQIADRINPPEGLARDIEYIFSNRTFGKSDVGVLDSNNEAPYFRKIVELVSEKSQVNFEHYRLPTLTRRLENRMLLRKAQTLEEYWSILKGDSKEVSELFNNFLIGVTNFFRDPEAFDLLRSKVIPAVLEKGKPKGEPYRFWVPACSTGEEAYSIAMLVDRCLKNNKMEDVPYKIFASDIDEHAIRFALKGSYSMNIAADIPSDLRSEYLIREGDQFIVRPALRQRVMFAVQNLIGDPPFINMDLISCRNFLIYLKPEVQQKVLATLHFALQPEAFLFLGPSESLGEVKHAFTKFHRHWNVYTKRSGAQPKLRSSFRLKSEPAGEQNRNRITTMESNESDQNGAYADTDPFTLFLVERYAPVSLFVTPQLDVLYINGEAEQLLKMPRAIARMNLKKMLGEEDLLTFRSGIEEALSGNESVAYDDVILNKNDEKFKAQLRFEVPALDVSPQTQDGEVVLIEIFLEKDDNSPEDKKTAPQDLVEGKVSTLQQQLRASKRRSQELVNELEATNEELQTSNRELMASNEELQSTNEELQSVNEELYTVNSELQMKNEELTIANNDVSNLLKSTEIGTIFLDKELKIRRFTPAVRQQFNLIDSDQGRSITNFSSTFRALDIEAVCQQVFKSLSTFEKEVVDKKGDHYLMRILPYRTNKDYIDGLVLTFVNINELNHSRNQSEKAEKIFEQFANHAKNQQVAIVNEEGKIHYINRASFTGKAPEDLKGQSILEFLPDDARPQATRLLENVFAGKPFDRLQFAYNYKGGKKGKASLLAVPVILNGRIKFVALIEDMPDQ